MAKSQKMDPALINGASPKEEIFVLRPSESSDPILIRETLWKGRRRISIRAYYLEIRTGKYFPTRRGIEVPLRCLEQLMESLQMVHDHIVNHSSDQGRTEFDPPEFPG